MSLGPDKEMMLYRRFPRLFSAPVRGGFCIGDGWFDIFVQMCEEIEEMLASAPNTRFVLMQVKTKFGEPTIYSASSPDGALADKMKKAITKARGRMLTTCEICGAPGGYDDYQVLCPKCGEERRAEKSLRGM